METELLLNSIGGPAGLIILIGYCLPFVINVVIHLGHDGPKGIFGGIAAGFCPFFNWFLIFLSIKMMREKK